MERLEAGGKINTTEKLRLNDILQDTDGNLKPGDTMEGMKKELKRLKIVENREETFAMKTEVTGAFYVRDENNRNCQENRSRYDTWRKNIKNEGYKRSGTNPQYF